MAEKYKIFIGWSLEPSESVANVLAAWLDKLFPGQVETFVSEREITGGEISEDKIQEFISTADAGIFCFAPNNLASGWMHSESGAVIANIKNKLAGKKNLVVPFLIQIKSSNKEFRKSDTYRGLIRRYQQVEWDNQVEIFNLIKGINSRLQQPHNTELIDPTSGKSVLQQKFDDLYPELVKEFEIINQGYPPSLPAEAKAHDPLCNVDLTQWEEEILNLLFLRGSVNNYSANTAHIYSLRETEKYTQGEIYQALLLLKVRRYIESKEAGSMPGYLLTASGISFMENLYEQARGDTPDPKRCK